MLISGVMPLPPAIITSRCASARPAPKLPDGPRTRSGAPARAVSTGCDAPAERCPAGGETQRRESSGGGGNPSEPQAPATSVECQGVLYISGSTMISGTDLNPGRVRPQPGSGQTSTRGRVRPQPGSGP